MSRWFLALAASACALVVSSSSVQAQDGRGSHGGGWRTSTSYYRPAAVPVVVAVPTPVPVAVAPAAPVPAPGSVIGLSVGNSTIVSAPLSSASPARIKVIAPEGAQVWFDGKLSDSKEVARTFTSAPIEAGQTAKVSVKVDWSGNTHEMQFTIHGGDVMNIDLRGAQ